jgi:homoserine kinase
MMDHTFTIRVPATTANLGPGFDCLALALDLWNQTLFCLSGKGIRVEVHGEGLDKLPEDKENMVARAASYYWEKYNVVAPPGLLIHCDNHIPLGSGLGSSAAAILTGMLAARKIARHNAADDELLMLASQLEGHSDNISACLKGGLVGLAWKSDRLITSQWNIPRTDVVLVIPEMDFPTTAARAALPKVYDLEDVVFNLGRGILVSDALRKGDLELLGDVMDDRIHQPFRFKLIPGSHEALAAARNAGAAACALSGAGPSLIAFVFKNPDEVAQAMKVAFSKVGVKSRSLVLNVSNQGAMII